MFESRRLKTGTQVAILSLVGLSCPAAFAGGKEKQSNESSVKMVDRVGEDGKLAMEKMKQESADLNELRVPTLSLNDRQFRIPWVGSAVGAAVGLIAGFVLGGRKSEKEACL